VTRDAPPRDVLWRVLETVPDPEVPVLSVVDLGIVRDIRREGDEVVVDITPTYSGCPAMRTIEEDIVSALRAAGIARPRVRTVFQPAWTTEWLSDAARARLREYGIAPPGPVSSAAGEQELVPLRRRSEPVPCPFCGSTDTDVRSEFGATACKAICFCNACRQPFEYFKPL
jgi:ring-1,2-phenylacetyl-CoA epoxidase subunit PaaD